MSLGEGPMSLDGLGEGPMSLDGDGAPPAKSSGGDALRSEIAAKKQVTGSRVSRETTQTGRPRLRPRVYRPSKKA